MHHIRKWPPSYLCQETYHIVAYHIVLVLVDDKNYHIESQYVIYYWKLLIPELLENAIQFRLINGTIVISGLNLIGYDVND